MNISPKALMRKAKQKGLSLNALLRQAGVSKTAYYALLRRHSLLPTSVHALANSLNVSESEILSPVSAEIKKVMLRTRKLSNVMRHFPKANKENVWHTLVLLELDPIERLRSALRRGKSTNLLG